MIARMTRWMPAASPLCMMRGTTLGTICHETPNLSVSQPHWPGFPPSPSRSQYRSTSAWSAQSTMSEIAGVKANCGPPFESEKLLSLDLEQDRHHGALGPRSAFAVPRGRDDPAAGEDRQIVSDRLLGLEIEPQTGCDLLLAHGARLPSPGNSPSK